MDTKCEGDGGGGDDGNDDRKEDGAGSSPARVDTADDRDADADGALSSNEERLIGDLASQKCHVCSVG